MASKDKEIEEIEAILKERGLTARERHRYLRSYNKGAPYV